MQYSSNFNDAGGCSVLSLHCFAAYNLIFNLHNVLTRTCRILAEKANAFNLNYTIPKRKYEGPESEYTPYGYQDYGQQYEEINDMYSQGSSYQMGNLHIA